MNEKTSSQELIKEIYDLRGEKFIDSRYNELTKVAGLLASSNDLKSAKTSLKEVDGLLLREASDLQASKELVDEQ